MSDDNTNEVIFYNIGFHLVALSPVGHLVFIVKEMSTGRVKYPAQQVVSNLGLVDWQHSALTSGRRWSSVAGQWL